MPTNPFTITKFGSDTVSLTSSLNANIGTVAVSGGNLTVSGSGIISSATAVTVNPGATLLLDNGSTASNVRLASTAALTLTGGTLQINGNQSGGVAEQAGTLAIGPGISTINLNPTNAAGAYVNLALTTTFTSSTLTQSGGGLLLLNMTNVIVSAQGQNPNNSAADTGVTVGNGTNLPVSLFIGGVLHRRPRSTHSRFLYSGHQRTSESSTAVTAGTGTDFVGIVQGNGNTFYLVRPLIENTGGINEYAASLTANQNALLTSATVTSGATINAVNLAAGGSIASGSSGTLTVTSGGVILNRER